jgi:hypothetical protein
MGNFNTCSIDSCNKFVEARLNNYKAKLAIDEYRKQMMEKGIDIDKLKDQWKTVYNKLYTVSEIDSQYNKLMKQRGKNQLTTFNEFGRKNKKIRSKRKRRRSRN